MQTNQTNNEQLPPALSLTLRPQLYRQLLATQPLQWRGNGVDLGNDRGWRNGGDLLVARVQLVQPGAVDGAQAEGGHSAVVGDDVKESKEHECCPDGGWRLVDTVCKQHASDQAKQRHCSLLGALLRSHVCRDGGSVSSSHPSLQHSTIPPKLSLVAKWAVSEALVEPAATPQRALHTEATQAVARKKEPVSGANISRVRPTSLMTSANRRQLFTLWSNCAPPIQAKTRLPSMEAPSRSTHWIVAAQGVASSVGVGVWC